MIVLNLFHICYLCDFKFTMLENLGLFGLFLGCLLSATIIPFSSEALVSGASLLGYNVWVIVIVASIGNTIGGMISFGMGWLCKWEWLEKYFRVKREKLEKVRWRHYCNSNGISAHQSLYHSRADVCREICEVSGGSGNIKVGFVIYAIAGMIARRIKGLFYFSFY